MNCATCGAVTSYIGQQAMWWCDHCQAYTEGPPPRPAGAGNANASSGAQAAGAQQASNTNGAVVLGIICAAATLICPFLPWISSPLASLNGVDGGGDGWIVLALGVVPLLLFIRMASMKVVTKGAGVGLLLCGGAQTALLIFDLTEILERIDGIELVKVGIGMYVGLAGAVFVTIIGLWAAFSGESGASASPAPARTIACPFCAEHIQLTATVCPHCQKRVVPA